MQSYINFFDRISNGKTLLLLLAVYILFPVYFLKNAESRINELAGKKTGVIDLTFGFSPDKTLDMVHEYGDAARDYYAKTEMTTDIVYPITYCLLFSIVLTLLYRGQSMINYVLFLPLLMMLFDFLENLTIVNLLKSYPDSSKSIAVLCEIFKILKWIAFADMTLMIVLGLFKKIKSVF